MSKLKLDRNKPFAQTFGDDKGRHFEQDGHTFTADGSLWVDPHAPAKKETHAERAEREKAEKEEADRLEAEAKKPPAEADQLSKQLAEGAGAPTGLSMGSISGGAA